MKKYIDLHVHSTVSDGTFTPCELVHYAIEKNLSAFALTDHDTTDGLEEAFQAASGNNLEIIPGIELSTTWNSTDVHIVGLDIDWKNTYFQKTLSEFQASRELRNEKMIARLQKEGIPITAKLMEKDFPDSVWTRAHFARFLFDHKYVGSMKEAFDRYLGNHAKCYVPREKVTPFQAIQLIHEGGGKAIFAHPILSGLSKERLESLIDEMSNTRSVTLLTALNTYPVIPIHAHVRPFRNYWLNLLCGIVFPIGLFFYFRIWAFRIRLNKDMERIIKTNEDVIGIIERDQNK